MNLSFTVGLLIGQSSVILLLILIIKYFIFSDVDVAIEKKRKKKLKRGEGLDENVYKYKTKYESVEWINSLLSGYYGVYREYLDSNGVEIIEKLLNRRSIPLLDRIEVNNFEIGYKYPQLSNARITEKGECLIDFDYNDQLLVETSSKFIINYPRERLASIPIDISIKLIRFNGCVSMSIEGGYMVVSLHSNYNLILKCQSQLGSKAKLQDIPKLEEIIINNIDNLLTTKFKQFKIKLL